MSIEDVNAQTVIEFQRARLARLQEFVDGMGAKFIQTIPLMFNSMDLADDTRQQYDKAWFDSVPYSQECKRAIARAFLDGAQQYPTLTTLDWESIANA